MSRFYRHGMNTASLQAIARSSEPDDAPAELLAEEFRPVEKDGWLVQAHFA